MKPIRIACCLALPIMLAACASAPSGPANRCSGACQTHEDGYAWAQRGNLDNPRECKGYTTEFARGCRDAIEDYRQLQPAAKGW